MSDENNMGLRQKVKKGIVSLDEAIEQIDAVTTADVRQFAANLVSKAPAAMALYGPVSQGPALYALKSRNAA